MLPTILLVDDNQDLLTTYQVLLPTLGFTVLTASDGLQGLEMVATYGTQLACVVIDVRMPELDGYQLIQAIRGDPQTEHVPLVMLTAMTQALDHTRGDLVGADFYLDKPVLPEILIATIRQAAQLTPAQRIARLLSLAKESNDAEGPRP